jgi:hypothetical protein
MWYTQGIVYVKESVSLEFLADIRQDERGGLIPLAVDAIKIPNNAPINFAESICLCSQEITLEPLNGFLLNFVFACFVRICR